MALEWLGSSREPSLPDLIARRKYGRAIAVLKAQLERDSPTPQGRLQLADLLVQAGRPAEAVPVFLELADQFARDGFVAKAIAVLKRVGRIAPDQDVTARLEELVRTQRRLDTGSAPSPPPTTTAFVFEMEEIPEEPEDEAYPDPEAAGDAEPVQAAAPLEPGDADDPEGAPEPPPAPDPELEILPDVEPDAEPDVEPGPEHDAEPDVGPEPEPEPEPDAEPEPEHDAEPEPVVESEVEAVAPVSDLPSRDEPEAEPELQIEPDPEAAEAALPAEAPPEADAAPSEPEADASGPGVKERIRNAFKRFLRQSVPEEEAPGPELPAPAEADPEPPSAEPPIEVDTGELAVVRPAADEGEGGLTEAAFHGQLLDTIQVALQQPAEAPPPAAPGAEPARKLLATPLFRGLDESELLAVMQELELLTCRPGDVIVSEGALGDRSLFVISSGTVRVFVRGPSGRNVQVGTLTEGDFFGEMSGLSGQPRAATVTASTACELLELSRPRVDDIARSHPGVRDRLDQRFVARASSPEAAAVRVVPLEGDSARRAGSVLAAHFGESRWDPRMRLRLARLLIQSGKEDDAVPVLISLADELSRAGDTARAVAIIKKVEQIQNRHIQEINLAPLERGAGTPPDGAGAAGGADPEPDRDAFRSWLGDLVRRGSPARSADPPSPPPAGYDGLQTSPLFSGFSEDELVTLFDSFRLRQAEPGELLVTEGERSDGLFVLCNGRVRVWVRNPSGRDVELCELSEGAFFGEISTLSGRPRSATVCAASRCELLELEKDALEQLADSHPRVRRVLEEFVAARSSSEDAARIRGRVPREGA